MAKQSEVWDKICTPWASKADIEEGVKSLHSHECYPIVINELSRIKKGSFILDAGCGLGYWAFLFQKMGYQGCGVDIARHALRKIGKCVIGVKNLSNVFVCGDVRALPFRNDTFSFIFCHGVIEHFLNPAIALKEYHRVLLSGGKCFITVPGPFSFHSIVGRAVSSLTERDKGKIYFEKSYTPSFVNKLMQTADFEVTSYGILPSGLMLGVFYGHIPIINKYLQQLMKKISYIIERKQSLLGFYSYSIGIKSPMRTDILK